MPANLLQHILRDGAILSLLATVFILITIRINPRLWLGDYPKPIQEQVPPQSEREKQLSRWIGIPFLILLLGVPLVSTWRLQSLSQEPVPFISLFLTAAGVAYCFNLVDWLLIDWLVFCSLTPDFIVIPGTKGHHAYKDYGFHFRGFLTGTLFSAIAGLILAGIVWLVGKI
jgi:hypothetical protein